MISIFTYRMHYTLRCKCDNNNWILSHYVVRVSLKYFSKMWAQILNVWCIMLNCCYRYCFPLFYHSYSRGFHWSSHFRWHCLCSCFFHPRNLHCPCLPRVLLLICSSVRCSCCSCSGLLNCWVWRHFILRFWNQTFTCKFVKIYKSVRFLDYSFTLCVTILTGMIRVFAHLKMMV